MTKEQLLVALLDAVLKMDGVESASRIEGEVAIGIELADGTEYFIEVQDV